MGLKSCLLTHTHILNTVTTTLIMSWQSYVDDQLISTKMIKNAVIAGHDGNIWAHSAGFPVSVEELKTLQALIVCVYEDPVVPEQAATVTEKLGEYLISWATEGLLIVVISTCDISSNIYLNLESDDT